MERESPAESVSRRAFPMPNISRGPTSRPRDQPVEERDQEATRRKKKKRKKKKKQSRARGRERERTGQSTNRLVKQAERKTRHVCGTAAEMPVARDSSDVTCYGTVCVVPRPPLFPFRLLVISVRRSAISFGQEVADKLRFAVIRLICSFFSLSPKVRFS